MSKFYNTPLEEQETNIYIDHLTKQISCYTSRYAVYNRLIKKLGDPLHEYYMGGKVCGAKWSVPFSDKKGVKTILSMTIVIGQC